MTGKRPTRKAASSHDKTSKPVSAKSSAPGVSQRNAGKTTGKMAKTNAAPKKGAAGKLAARKSPVSKPAPAKLGSGGGQPAEGKKSAPSRAKKKVRLLAGGNPQIAKADGDAPVQAYIAALSGWKQELAGRLDQLITQVVPDVQKAVKWNSPFYGLEGKGWFLGVHTFTRYLKVNFFRGSALRPLPPVTSSGGETRYVHLSPEEPFDEAQLADWIRQAAALPGWSPGR